MRFVFIFFLFAGTTLLHAIEPPKKGVALPPNFQELKKEIEKSYPEGYFAEKFKARAKLREEMTKGLIPRGVITKDTVRVLVLMGQYSDATTLYPAASFQTHLFDGPNATGTITQYYEETSYNQLHVIGTCKGWTPVAGTMNSYVGTTKGLSASGGPQFMYDLVQAADAAVNYADYIQYYDGSGNPRIAFIAGIHPGGDAAAGAVNIWSHKWTFGVVTGNQPYTTNDIDPVSGKKVLIDGLYALEPELKGTSNTSGGMSEIGVFAHEFGHTFGLPDLYDTDNSSEGIGQWCLMASGSWGGNGSSPETPTHMSAWCKQKLGWVTPTQITSFQKQFEVTDAGTNPVMYKLWKKNTTGSLEYFLIENRQKTGFDKNLPGSGLLIFHIDDAKSTNTDENHPLVGLMQADGRNDLNTAANRGDGGDIFPGTSSNTTFDYLSVPNSNSYSGGPTYVSIRNIQQSGQSMFADIDIGTLPYIKFNSVSCKEVVAENGRVEPGETADVAITVTNNSPAASAQSTVSFSIADPGIEILKSSVTDSIGGLGQKTFTMNGAFKVQETFIPKTVQLKYTISSEGGVISDSQQVTLGIPPVVVISKGERPDLIKFYDSSLTAGAIGNEQVMNRPAALLSRRKVAVYFSGQATDTIFTSAEIDSLTAFIHNGGHLFLSGQNMAEYLSKKYPDFLANELGISWVKSNNILTQKAYGKSSDFLGQPATVIRINGTNGAVNEKSTDVISSNGQFHLSFSYKADGTDGAGGWIQKPSGSKIFFMGFGFESMNNNESTLSRDKFMRMVFNWFDGISDVKGEKAASLNFRLFENYPNPFNPSTVIRYSIPARSNVSLTVYDILGNKIASLVNEEKAAGTYQAVFDPNTLNRQLASGIYFYQIEAGTFKAAHKMLFIK